MHSISISVLQIVVSAVVAISVVALGHAFTLSRDRHNRRQEQRISYLIEAYRGFAEANNHPRLYEVAEKLERAVADVQLFGTPHQAELARRFATDLGNLQAADLDELLFELCDSLRAELGAEPITSRIVWLRVERKEERSSD